jgi:8-oxo-dGTP diphosphatase
MADSHEGEVRETEEALPLWTPVDAIPYGEMWADDIHWLPGMLEGKRFRAWFIFESDTMRDRRIEWLAEAPFTAPG